MRETTSDYSGFEPGANPFCDNLRDQFSHETPANYQFRTRGCPPGFNLIEPELIVRSESDQCLQLNIGD